MKIKVLHVLNTSTYSGAENVAISIINQTKNNVNSYYASLDGSISEVLEENKIKFYSMQKLTVRNLKKIIQLTNPDVIHAHDYTATIISTLCFPQAKIVSHIHNNSPWIKKRGVYSIVFFVSSLFVSKILTVSNSIEEEYVFSKFIRHKIKCISNPIDVTRIINQANEIKYFNSFDYIYLGRITDQKNPDLLFDIIEKTVKIKNDVKVAIIGEGDLYQLFKKRISDSNFVENVTIFGFQSNPYPILKKSKALCLPSKWEGFGLVAIEAMALGVPVVCSGVGGLKDIVTNQCGKICNQLNDYVCELYELLSDNDYWEKKHKCALSQAKQLDNSKEYYCQLLEVYKRVLERKYCLWKIK
ncbi:MAG: glycosyltransferase [Beduini sp.]|uniref:glycosyltransferase n=1 Tax=Beduini sp. TaxID=1922300 RepID=UPI0011CA340D